MKNFKYFTDATGKKIVAVTHLGSHVIRGTAKCSDKDEFDSEVGKKLARLRCEVKVAEKKFKLSCQDMDAAMKELGELHAKYWKVSRYVDDRTAYSAKCAQELREKKQEYEDYVNTL